MEEKIERVTEKDKIVDFMEEKIKREEYLEQLEEKKERIEHQLEEERESYTRFINNFLFKDSDIKVKINFDGE